MKTFTLTAVVVLLIGCNSFHVIDKTYSSINPGDVRVLYQGKPECETVKIADIEVSSYFDGHGAIVYSTHKAAEFGADHLQIVSVNGAFYYTVKSIAYKCLDEPKT